MKWLAGTGLILMAACGGHKSEAERAAPRAPVAVAVESAALAPWPEVYQATGTVRAKVRATLSARVPGTVREIRAEPGTMVRKGQLLVSLDAAELSAAAAGAEAGTAEAKAAIPELETAIESAQAQLALAEATHRRMQELYAKRSITAQEMDEAEARRKQAVAALRAAEARRAQIDARIAQAGQAVTAANTAKGYTEVFAPFDGIVEAKHAETGTVAAPGVPLLTLEQAGAYRLETPVEESRAPLVRLGQTLRLIWDDGGGPESARVSEISPLLDPVTRTLLVKSDLPASAGMRSGRFARAEWKLADRQALSVPVAAVREAGQLQMIFIAESGVAHMRMVTLGAMRDARREVLSGLQPGELVIAPIPAGLADGMPVEAKR